MRNAEQDQAVTHWLKPAQVAADPRLGVSVAQVLRYVAAGELEAINVGKLGGDRPTYRINPASVDAFVDRRRVRVG